MFTVSGNHRDGFPDKMELLDRAIQLAASGDDGVVSGWDREVAAALETGGTDAVEAQRLGQIRIFSPKAGAYGVGAFPVSLYQK